MISAVYSWIKTIVVFLKIVSRIAGGGAGVKRAGGREKRGTRRRGRKGRKGRGGGGQRGYSVSSIVVVTGSNFRYARSSLFGFKYCFLLLLGAP